MFPQDKLCRADVNRICDGVSGIHSLTICRTHNSIPSSQSISFKVSRSCPSIRDCF